MVSDALETEDSGCDDGCSGSHGFDEDEAEALLAGVWCAEDVGVLIVGGEFGVGYRPGEDDIVDATFAHHSP